jgi:hypothetical protein
MGAFCRAGNSSHAHKESELILRRQFGLANRAPQVDLPPGDRVDPAYTVTRYAPLGVALRDPLPCLDANQVRQGLHEGFHAETPAVINKRQRKIQK